MVPYVIVYAKYCRDMSRWEVDEVVDFDRSLLVGHKVVTIAFFNKIQTVLS